MAWFFNNNPAHRDRHRRVFELLGIIWVISLADLFLTVWAHRFTCFYEMNPIARALLDHGATTSLIIFKVTMTCLGTLLFWTMRRHGRAEIALWGIAGIYVMLAFQWSTYTSAAVMIAIR
jgi:hypothetical protein